MRNPEGVWGWLVKKRRDLKSSGRYLTNREMLNYFKATTITTIANSHKLHEVIERHCATLDNADQMKESDAEKFQESFGKFMRTIDEPLNTGPTGKQFGEADVSDNTRIIATNSYRTPGSRAKGRGNSRDGGKRGKGTRREPNVTNWGSNLGC